MNSITFLLRPPWLCLCGLGMAVCLGGTLLSAQNTPATSDAIPTLHVYTNLVQIPVLVLTPTREKLLAPIAPNRFSISFDGGPSFQPTYARLEGDDPIDLSIVLDIRSLQIDLIERIDQTIADLAPSFLHPGDHVSIYAIDCSSMDFVQDVPVESGLLKRAVDSALSIWTARTRGKKAACNPETPLWDLLAYATAKLSAHSGRRVVLAVTNGQDKKSKRSLADLTDMAKTAGISIFGLDPTWPRSSMSRTPDEGQLELACEQTGGMMLDLSDSSAARTMRQFIQMVRERYILEFPRPPTAHPGQVKMSVKIDKLNAFIRPSSDGLPLADRGEMANSATILPEPQTAPQVDVVSSEHAPAAAPVAQQPSPGTTIPTLKVETKLTVEDVTVTDAQRRPVHGLMRSDFTIKEDGKPQTLRDFEEYGAEKPAQSTPADLPANTYTNAQPPSPSTSAVNILLLDNVTTGLRLIMAPEYTGYARQQAIKYLKRMPPGTQVAILELGNGLRVVQGVTTDPAILVAAMNAFSPRWTPRSSMSPPESLMEACVRLNQQSQQVVVALDQAAAFLAGIKGRKNLIWFTPGIPWLTSYGDFSQVYCLNDYTAQLERAYGLLNEAQVALYPVDPRGLVASWNPNGAFMDSLSSERASLQDLADATGGVAFFNRNDLDGAVEQAIATGTDYYSLSYIPPLTKYDGAHHTINVKVDRPNLNLQYRPGYTSVDLTKAPQASDHKASKSEPPPPPSALDLAMGHGTAPATQLLFDVRVTPSTTPPQPGDPLAIGSLSPTLKGKPLVRYDVLFTLSGDQIALLDGPDGTRQASINLLIEAYDAEGKELNFVGQSAKWRIKPEQAAQFMRQSLPVPMQIDLPAGKIFVRLGIVDSASQKIGTLEIPETVAK